MKLVLDACAGRRLAKGLRLAGHEVDFIGDWAEDPGDDEILAYAFRTEAIVITRDKDFGTLAVLHGRPHHGIIRLVQLPPGEEQDRCLGALCRFEGVLKEGALITLERNRTRIRPRETENENRE